MLFSKLTTIPSFLISEQVIFSIEVITMIINYAFILAFTIIMIQIYRDTRHKKTSLLSAILKKKWQSLAILLTYISSYIILTFFR